VLTIARQLDRQRCAQRALAFALEAGCGTLAADQFALSSSELAGNVLRHAGSGLSAVRRFMDFLSVENDPAGGARVVIRKRSV